MTTTWDTLRPLSRSGWSGDAGVWKALLGASPVVRRAVGRVWRRAAPGQLACADELYHETICLIAHRANRMSGLADPQTWGDGCPEVWLGVVVQHAAIDALRRKRARPWLSMSRGAHDAAHAFRPEYADAIDLQRKLDARPGRSELYEAIVRLPAIWRLAWLALEWPEALDADVVAEACAAHDRSRGRNGGLARPRQETWTRLKRWRRAHAADPTSADARLGLAWALRSTDRVSPEAWRARDPDAAARGRDTLRQWHARAVERIATLRAAA